ncbi:MAG: chemotaxis protein CheA [Bacteroidetes bacterium]|nr:chemotaxis protein CheA [Bacteroidota bacterium]
MEQFKKKFLEEAQDLINNLENSLLFLEENPNDKKIIEEVFRVMHSLKGGSSMFEFQKMEAFTHELETVYDLVRNDKISVSREVLDVTLESVDHLKVLLLNDEALTDNDINTHQSLLARIKKIVSNSELNEKNSTNVPATKEMNNISEVVLNISTDKFVTYYIKVETNPELFQNGSNPLLLIDELHTLGHCKAYYKKHLLPKFTDLEAEKCYSSWEVFLATDKTEDDIKDVFIFVDDKCNVNIKKVADINLLSRQSFKTKLESLIAEDNWTNLEKLEKEISTLILKETESSSDYVKEFDTNSTLVKKTAINNIRVSSDKLDELMSLVSELVTTQASLTLYAEKLNNPELAEIAENIEKLSRQLRDNAFEICLIPIETIMIRFKRLVRDLSIELNKDIQFIAEGTETELDKSIIEGLTDPLMHIFRNAIDHGIENTDERLLKGKPKQGKIILKAFYSGTNVFIQIKDDGKGIDVEKIRLKAIDRGFISKESNLSYKEILQLVFLPGFSTATKVTELSGRGVGLDVVVKKISEIRGEVEIESQLGVGTSITIKLPMTLSIIDGLLVSIGNTSFVIPLSSVDKCFEIRKEKINSISEKNKINLDGSQISFINLRNEFNIAEKEPDLQQIIQIIHEETKIALLVDAVIGEYQAVLKPLGRAFKDLEIVSGATILGDGSIALVLDPSRIVLTFDRETLLKRTDYYRRLGDL